MVELDKRIIEYLNKKGLKTEEEIQRFISPDSSMLNNPFDLSGMAEAVKRIEEAIDKKQKIVVYGDYDCDGISACVILYKYLQSRGNTPDVYIPDRFDDGYGLSPNMIDEVLTEARPDLIITVDLGVTAVSEVEAIKAAGVDIIVTDHHEPSSTLPNCILIDPKIEGQKYPFNGLCGAGVALKLVEALGGKEAADKYLDICAVATIGDIVPLVEENRYIAKTGIERLNKRQCLKSYKYMLSELNIKNLSGQDVTFKLVPRINACGRMSKGKKVFDFLIEENDKKLKSLFNDIVADNEERLNKISEGAVILDKQMQNIDLASENIILLQGDFHQGVLGILASRICHDYNRPAIVFTTTDEGTLKGSGRSLDDIDLHRALEECSACLIRYGGHKMAVGVEVKKEDFDKLKAGLRKSISKQVSMKAFIEKEAYDIKISEEDICKEFIDMLSLLEPFGCKNEKPVLMLETNLVKVMQMKDASYRHFKLTTPKGKSIVAFAAEKNVDILKMTAKKHLIVELENDVFRGKVEPQAILKNVYLKEVCVKEDKERENMISLINKYYSEGSKAECQLFNSEDLEKTILSLGGGNFGTLVVVDNYKDAEKIKAMLPKFKNFTLSHVPLKNRQNTLLVSGRGVLDSADIIGYNNVVFTRQKYFHEKDYFAAFSKVFVAKCPPCEKGVFTKNRDRHVYSYNLIKKYAPIIRANNIFEWLDKLKAAEGGVNKLEVLFSLLCFDELGFVKLSLGSEFSLVVEENPPRKELTSSKFMNRMA